MLRKFVVAGLVAFSSCAAGGACAMTPQQGSERCHVSGAENLPSDSGGAQALCAAIEKAAAARAPGVGFTVKVQVRSAHSLGATVTTSDGRTLPEQELSVSDRTLTASSFERFAKTLADNLANSTK